MNAYLLEVTNESGQSETVHLQHFPFWVGRDHGNDLVLHDPIVSRRHAFIQQLGKQLSIVDNQSRNGVMVNDEPVSDQQDMLPGDRVVIGPYTLRLALTTQSADTEPYGDTRSVDYFRALGGDPVVNLTAGFLPTSAGRKPLPWETILRLLVRGSTEELYALILEIVESIVSFDRCLLIFFSDLSLETMEVAARRFGSSRVRQSTAEVFVSRGVLRRVIQTGEPVTVTDREVSLNVRDSLVRSGACSVLCVPITSGHDVYGVLYLDRLLEGRPFQEQIIEELAPLMALVSLKIENVRLVEEQLQDQLTRRELEIAQSVQQRFLPANELSLSGYSFEAYNQPCRYVGGDCLDFLLGADGKLTFAVGDVSGKGLPAALYMVGVLSTMRAHIVDGFSLDVVMAKLEQYVRSRFNSDHFLSLLLAELDPDRGVLTYCNAGHVLPVVFKSGGRVVEFEERAPALNITPWQDFPRTECLLTPGDLLLVYTDGIIEKQNDQDEMFGKQRLLETVQENINQDLKTIRQAILARLRSFGSTPALDDDVTLAMLRRARG